LRLIKFGFIKKNSFIDIDKKFRKIYNLDVVSYFVLCKFITSKFEQIKERDLYDRIFREYTHTHTHTHTYIYIYIYIYIWLLTFL